MKLQLAILFSVFSNISNKEFKLMSQYSQIILQFDNIYMYRRALKIYYMKHDTSKTVSVGLLMYFSADCRTVSELWAYIQALNVQNNNIVFDNINVYFKSIKFVHFRIFYINMFIKVEFGVE